MHFLVHIIYILIYLFAIIFSCCLFTNAIEHLGDRLKLGSDATGSILTVIGTTLPETIVPIVAILSVYLFGYEMKTNEEIALGAIVGSPFMLSCLSLFLLGIILILKKRKELNLDYTNVIRDYRYFLIAYPVSILTTFLPSKLRFIPILFLVSFYCIFVYRTIIKSKECYISEELDELIFLKFFKKQSNLFLIILQIMISSLGLIIFSHLFMREIVYFSNILNVSPLILSLIITPFATELPECVNSIIWTMNKKDELAIANILGAIIFQTTILTSIGMLLTTWVLDKIILINSVFVILSSIIFVFLTNKTKTIKLSYLLNCGVFYFGFFILILFLYYIR